MWAGGPVTIRDAGLDSFFFRRTPKTYQKQSKKQGSPSTQNRPSRTTPSIIQPLLTSILILLQGKVFEVASNDSDNQPRQFYVVGRPTLCPPVMQCPCHWSEKIKILKKATKTDSWDPPESAVKRLHSKASNETPKGEPAQALH